MKTLNFAPRCFGLVPLCLSSFLLTVMVPLLRAQEEAAPPAATKAARPERSDAASQQLIRNYLTVTGGAAAYNALDNLVARGDLTEAGKEKAFTLIESQDGRRHLTLEWRHLGRDYEARYVFDGLETWRQQIRPELEDPRTYEGQEAVHFAHQRWLLQPFVLPSVADYTFKYQGAAKVGGRECHVIVGYGLKDVRSWFYFDKEKFLLLRWGGFGELAGVREYMDYRATSFRRAGGVLLPRAIDLLAEDAAFGKIEFEEILTNQDIDRQIFVRPRGRTPVLRQRPVSRD